MVSNKTALMGAAGAGGSEYLYGWGYNADGQLGLGDVTNRSEPTLLDSTENEYTEFQIGSSAFFIKKDGTLWSTGDNNSGQLGLGDITDRSSPVQVGSLTTWTDVPRPAGNLDSFIIGLSQSGTVFSIGNYTSGRLGLNDLVSRSSPTQMGSETWSQASCTANTSLALRSDGTIWGWGYNAHGNIGDGTTVNKSSPVQIGALTTWTQIAAHQDGGFAIKNDGTLWSWGRNNYGQLGLGDTTNRSSPVQVGADTDWSFIAGGYQSTLATKTNGTLWSWGRNNYGQLGLGDTTDRSSPTQIGSLTTWTDNIVAGALTQGAIDSSSNLWMWGYNAYGQLGQNNTTNYSSPVQIAGTWSKIRGGRYSFAAVKVE